MSRLQLPNGIKHEGKLYNIAHLEEMTGKQQNYLVNSKYKTPIDHIEPILADLITRFETQDGDELKLDKLEVVSNILQAEDATFLIVKLREITFGERHVFEKKECPHCNKKQDVLVNLDKLEVIKVEEQEMETELPKSGAVAKYRPLSMKRLRSYIHNVNDVLDSVTTTTLAMIIESVGEDTDITPEKVGAMSAKDLKHIKEHTPKYNTLDTSITHQCVGCKEDFDFDMEVLTSDFLSL